MSQRSTTARLLRHTPMRDLIRFRVTGRLDIDTLLERSGLPAPAAQCVLRVVHRTRLWRLEKVSVTHELIAHFQDGLASGATCDDLLAHFGDEKQTSLLIRRAKKRNRSWTWQVTRACGWTLAALVLLYAGMVFYFLAGKSTIRTDYLAQFNAAAAAVPRDQAAWPLYRKALLELKLYSPEARAVFESPGGHDRFVREHQGAMALIRQAASRPGLGVMAGTKLEAEDLEALGDAVEPPNGMPIPNSWHINIMWTMARLLDRDRDLAIQNGDSSRVLEDLDAILGIARHVNETPDADGWARRILWSVPYAISEMLTVKPVPLSNEQLEGLAHRLVPLLTRPQFSLEGQRLKFHALVQQVFTDDGYGDGHLTPEGYRMLVSMRGEGGTTASEFKKQLPGAVREAMSAGDGILILASRRDLLDQYDRMVDQFEANRMVPMRDERQNEPARAIWENVEHQPDRYRLMWAWENRGGRYPHDAYRDRKTSQERWFATVEGTTLGIALELYHRDHGDWPQTLEALVPRYAPSLPVDRVTGGALKYRIMNGQPLIYSVGVDRDDDGGRVPWDKQIDKPWPWAAFSWWGLGEPDKAPDGDWVLWPQPRYDD